MKIKSAATVAREGERKMQRVFVHDRYYELDDDVNIINFAHQKRMEREKEWAKEREIKELKKENERLKHELEEKENQLALKETQESIRANNNDYLSQNEMNRIMDEGNKAVFQYALKEFKKIRPQKGIKIDWKIK